MSDPDAAATAAIAAEAAFYDNDEDIKGPSSTHGERLVRHILAAARPLIEAEARASERQRIRQRLDQMERRIRCAMCETALEHTAIADLLDGDGDEG